MKQNRYSETCMSTENPILIDMMLQEAIELSRITGTPVYQILGIPEDKFKELNEWLDKYYKEKQSYNKIMIPNFEVE